MARSIWRGAISFGLVSIPIRLYTATESKDVSFHLLHKACHSRIKQQRYCPHDEMVIEWGDVERGYEYAKDQYVVLEEEDFEKVPIATTKAIDITAFVGLDEVDPQYYERSYYLEPEDVGKKPYALLRKTLEETRRVAVAKVALRQKEQLCLIRAKDSVLVMQTMFYPDELRSEEELALPGSEVAVEARELQMARSLVDMLTAEFEPTQYRDHYREALLEVIEAKVSGHAIAEAPPAQGKVVDLMEALRASVEAVKKERSARTAPAKDGAEAEPVASAPARRRKAG